MRVLLVLVVCFLAAFLAAAVPSLTKRKDRFGKLSDANRKQMERSFSRTDIDKVTARLAAASARAARKMNNAENRRKVHDRGQKVRLYPRSRRLREGGDTVEEVNELAGLADVFYQGDVILTLDQLDDVVPSEEGRAKRSGAFKNSRYPNNTWIGQPVYWYFDPALTHEHTKSIHRQAVAFWQENTCIDFQESSTAENRIRVYQGVGCWSYFGKIGGEQDLSYGPGCDAFGAGLHEMGHALGFFHTQTRHDRDEYITINITNVAEDKQHNYAINGEDRNYNYGIPYEYGSVMQYNKQTFATDENYDAMIANDPLMQYTMGSEDIAFYDLSMMNEYYQCKARCPAATSATCYNGGFPHPRNCSKCICPEGYAGDDCNAGRPVGCGSDEVATGEWQNLTGTVGDGVAETRDRHHKCHYRITAPAGTRIEVKLTSYFGVSCRGGCPFGSIEFKALADPAKQGYRFCCDGDVGTTLVSETNVLPIVHRNRYYMNKFGLQYRYVAADTTAIPTTTKCIGTWSEWTSVGSCSDDCGMCGDQVQTRRCEPAGCECSGAASWVVPCGPAACLFPRSTCCRGVKTILNRQFICKE